MRCSSKLAVLALSTLATAAPTAHPRAANQAEGTTEIQPGLVRRVSSFFAALADSIPNSQADFQTGPSTQVNQPNAIAQTQQTNKQSEPITITFDRSVEDTPNKPRADEKTLLNTFIGQDEAETLSDRDAVARDLALASANIDKRDNTKKNSRRSRSRQDMVDEGIYGPAYRDPRPPPSLKESSAANDHSNLEDYPDQTPISPPSQGVPTTGVSADSEADPELEPEAAAIHDRLLWTPLPASTLLKRLIATQASSASQEGTRAAPTEHSTRPNFASYAASRKGAHPHAQIVDGKELAWGPVLAPSYKK